MTCLYLKVGNHIRYLAPGLTFAVDFFKLGTVGLILHYYLSAIFAERQELSTINTGTKSPWFKKKLKIQSEKKNTLGNILTGT